MLCFVGDLYFAYTTLEDYQNNRIYTCNLKNVELDVVLAGSYTTINVIPSKCIDCMALLICKFYFSSFATIVSI